MGLFKLWIIFGLMLFLLIGMPISLGLPVSRVYMVGVIKPITPLSPIFYLKVMREGLQKRFVFGEEGLAYFELTIAEKRIVEAEYLNALNLGKMSQNQSELAIWSDIKAANLMDRIQDKIDIKYLRGMLEKNQKRLADL